MTDDLKERLRPPGKSVISKCADVDGADLSNVPLTYERIWLQSDGGDGVTWCQHPQDDEDVPYVRADFYAASLARITDLEARLAAAEAENTRLKRQVETLKTGWGIADRDRIKAEAGEDALAEALRSYRADLCEGFCLEAEWSDEAHDHLAMQRDCGGCLAAAALAAYDARKG